MVIGPTPPGTGVIAPATGATLAKSTSPAISGFPSGPGTRLMPTSITVAPGLTQGAVTRPGRPTAATRMSARAQTSAGLRVRECATVTVQFSRSSSCAIGRPTMFERPSTTASRPARSPSRSRSSIRQPSGRAGHGGVPSAGQPPDVLGVEAVHVLAERHGVDHPRLVDVRGQRQLHQDAVHPRIAVQPVDERQQLGLAEWRRAGGAPRSASPPRGSGAPCCARRCRSPDRRRPAPPRGRGPARAAPRGPPPRRRPARGAARRRPCRR